MSLKVVSDLLYKSEEIDQVADNRFSNDTLEDHVLGMYTSSTQSTDIKLWKIIETYLCQKKLQLDPHNMQYFDTVLDFQRSTANITCYSC